MRTYKLTETQRKFAREVGSVVLGVLIALGIGEIAEAVRWKLRVDSSVAAMTSELGDNRLIMLERATYQPCVDNRLAEIGLLLSDARKTSRLPLVQHLGKPGARLMQTAAFDVAKSEGIPLHMDRTQARGLAWLYGASDTFVGFAEKERDYWSTLTLLENAPGPISDDLLTDLLHAWAGASREGYSVGMLANQVGAALAEGGVPVGYDEETPNRKALAKSLQDASLCRPLLVDGKPFVRPA
jgi:hypothetical protein